MFQVIYIYESKTFSSKEAEGERVILFGLKWRHWHWLIKEWSGETKQDQTRKPARGRDKSTSYNVEWNCTCFCSPSRIFFFTFFHFKKMLFVLISGLKIGEKGLVVPPHRPPRPLCSAAPEVYITVDEDEHWLNRTCDRWKVFLCHVVQCKCLLPLLCNLKNLKRHFFICCDRNKK